MAFGKRFPKDIPGSNFPQWVEIKLTQAEEDEIEEKARMENIDLLSRCIDDARNVLLDKGLKGYQSDAMKAAVALFEKLASHSVYHKEALCKKKFDSMK